MNIILFCLGIIIASLLSLFLPIVPPLFTLFILMPFLLGAIWRRSSFIAGALLFISLWLIQTNHYYLTQKSIPLSATNVIGTIIETPKQYQDYSQIMLLVDQGPAKGYRVQLNWSFAPEQLAAGQQWQLPVRLKPIAGVANPASVNSETNAMLKRILLQGSVIQGADPSLLTAKMLSSQFMLRPYLIKQLVQATSELATAPLLKALTIGERGFNQQIWQGLQLSALAHLMAISGLHIGLIFMCSLWLCKPFLVIKNVTTRLIIQYSLALGCALLYAWLAGFAIPTIRASLALLVVVICKVQHRSFSYLQYWLLIVAALLLFEPLFVISIGFWLSVLAVAIIFMLLWQQPKVVTGWRGNFVLFLRFHLYLTLMMTLFSIVFFNGGSLLALVSNIIFVPYTSMLAIPVLFITLIAELIQLPFTASLWQFTDWVFTPLLAWLEWCSQQDSWWAWPSVNWLTVLLLTLGLILFWLTRNRLALLFIVLASAVVSLTLWGTSIWQLHLIDVGQGLAVLLQKGQQGILYDVGPRYNNYSATAAIVQPFLRQTGIRQLDYVVLSHNDSDHTGDWRLIKQQYPELKLITNITEISSAQPCDNVNIDYLGAKIQFFALFEPTLSSKNDSSCLMYIELAGWKVLLTGDISARVERLLITQQPNLSADILLLAHHGSASSSDYGFLYHLAPLLAVNSASLYNRHQHPSAIVRQRLSLLDIPLLNTATSGAISLDIKPQNIQIKPYRQQRLPYWQQKPHSNAETLQATR